MKILHLIPTYLPAEKSRGPINPTHYLNKWLVKKGVDVTVYTTNLDGEKTLDVSLNTPVFIDGVRVFYFKSSFLKNWNYSCQFQKALKKNIADFDVVHITSVFLAFSTLGAFYAKKFKKPYVISPHGSLMKEPLIMKSPVKKKLYINFIEKRNLANAAAIHFTVEVERAEYIALGLPLNESFIIPNSFDPEEFKRDVPKGFLRKKFNISDGAKIILFLGRIGWKKGFDTLIPAFKKVVDQIPNAMLVIVGGDDGGHKKQVEGWIKKSDLTNKVIFTGPLVGNEKIAAFQDAQVFVLPSYSENFGMAVVEAMYLGLPVVITKYVGLAPNIEKVGAGLVIDKKDDELMNAVLSILNDSALSGRLADQGKYLVQDEFSAPPIADKFICEYNSIIADYSKY